MRKKVPPVATETVTQTVTETLPIADLDSQDWLDALEWVFLHLDDVPAPKELPSRHTRTLWVLGKASKEAFTKQYLPLLIRGRSVESSQVKWDGASACPVCKRVPDVMDEGSRAAVRLLEKAFPAK